MGDKTEEDWSVYVISSTKGMTLVFPSEESLAKVVEHLQGMLEWVRSDDIIEPYLYHIADNQLPVEDIDEWTDWVKDVLSRD